MCIFRICFIELDFNIYCRELKKQVQEARKRNQRAEGVVASAAHLLPGYEERGGRTPW